MINFLGEHSYQTVTISKLGYPAPLVSIQGTNPRDTTYSDELVLRADAELPVMACVSDSLSDAKMTYVWTETTGKYNGSLETTNPRILRISEEQVSQASVPPNRRRQPPTADANRRPPTADRRPPTIRSPSRSMDAITLPSSAARDRVI